LQFVGAAQQQTASFVREVEALLATHEEAARYTPDALL
jgi:hypothetical protein